MSSSGPITEPGNFKNATGATGPFFDDISATWSEKFLPADTSAPPQRPRNAPAKAKAHSYLSVVDGRPMRHATWAECERRVRGVSGARFKKSTSGADEARILRSWGYSPADVDH